MRRRPPRPRTTALAVVWALALLTQLGMADVQRRPPPDEPGEFYLLISANRGIGDPDMCANVHHASQADSALVIQYWCDPVYSNSQWEFVPTTGGFFQVRARHSDKCLHGAGYSRANSANVFQGALNNLWEFG